MIRKYPQEAAPSTSLKNASPHIDVFFNKPSRPFPLARLTQDIESASGQLAVASAWFTDDAVADAIIKSPASTKLIFLNAADVSRGSWHAYHKLDQYIERVRKEDLKQGTQKQLYILGSGDWKEGVMHHKFILVDHAIVWTGSYNLTHHAKKNYETILRIDDVEVCARFWQEVEELRSEQMLFLGTAQFASANGAFRCAQCEQLFPISEIGCDGDSWAICQRCVDR